MSRQNPRYARDETETETDATEDTDTEAVRDAMRRITTSGNNNPAYGDPSNGNNNTPRGTCCQYECCTNC